MPTKFSLFKTRCWQDTSQLQPLFSATQIKQLEQDACVQQSMASFELMQRAGTAAWQCVQTYYPHCRSLLVVCGTGNNGGDGYVLATLAKQQGIQVTLVAVAPPKPSLDAYIAYQHYLALGGHCDVAASIDWHSHDLIIDALLGTGLCTPMRSECQDLVLRMNQSGLPIVALDIPSGLGADTGCVYPVAVKAERTITFVALKRGMQTHEGPNVCGDIHCYSLDVSCDVLQAASNGVTQIDLALFREVLAPRSRNAHKGQMGHVWVIGGNEGMAGAVGMSALAALRVGAGRVSVLTHQSNRTIVAALTPELMVHGLDINQRDALEAIKKQADVMVVGPGLGRDAWADAVAQIFLQHDGIQKVIDADALHFVAKSRIRLNQDCVITPHPGEAATLLGTSNQQIQHDRFAAIEALQSRYACHCLLKGNGNLMRSMQGPTLLAKVGNPGMASGGMGDVLSGVIAGLAAQGIELDKALALGVCLHGYAADWVALTHGERGIIATDLLQPLHRLVNPD